MKIGIVGLGLMGGTIAKALKKEHHISAYDVSAATLAFAKEEGIIDEGYDDLTRFLQDNHLVFLCLYPKAIVNFIFQNKHLIPKDSVYIEISGIKKQLIKEIDKLRPLSFDLVFTHPVAGSEKTGVYHSNADIFKNANFVITPVSNNKKSSLELVRSLAETMGFKHISSITPAEHDAIIAYTSQLTHVLSISLVNALSTNLETRRFIGDSYRDLTRISMINHHLWPDLFLMNKEELLAKIEDFETELNKVKHALLVNDADLLARLMQSSTSKRSAIEGVKGK